MSRFVNLELDVQKEDNTAHRQVVKDAAYYLERANQAFADMDFEEALRRFSKVIEFDVGHVAAWSGQVRSLIELEEFQDANQWADKALEQHPEDPELLAAKAVTLGRIGELESAMSFSDASVNGESEIPYVWLARADVLLACDEQRAEFCFEKATALAAGEWLIAWLAARIRYWYKQFALAITFAQRAVEWNPGHASCWMQLAQCQQALGLVGPARESLGHVDQLRPHWDTTHQTRRTVEDTGFFKRVGGGIRSMFKK